MKGTNIQWWKLSKIKIKIALKIEMDAEKNSEN